MKLPFLFPDELHKAAVEALVASGRSRTDAVRQIDLSAHAVRKAFDTLETCFEAAELQDQMQVRLTAWNMLSSFLAFQSNLLATGLQERGMASGEIDISQYTGGRTDG